MTIAHTDCQYREMLIQHAAQRFSMEPTVSVFDETLMQLMMHQAEEATLLSNSESRHGERYRISVARWPVINVMQFME